MVEFIFGIISFISFVAIYMIVVLVFVGAVNFCCCLRRAQYCLWHWVGHCVVGIGAVVTAVTITIRRKEEEVDEDVLFENSSILINIIITLIIFNDDDSNLVLMSSVSSLLALIYLDVGLLCRHLLHCC